MERKPPAGKGNIPARRCVAASSRPWAAAINLAVSRAWARTSREPRAPIFDQSPAMQSLNRAQ